MIDRVATPLVGPKVLPAADFANPEGLSLFRNSESGRKDNYKRSDDPKHEGHPSKECGRLPYAAYLLGPAPVQNESVGVKRALPCGRCQQLPPTIDVDPAQIRTSSDSATGSELFKMTDENTSRIAALEAHMEGAYRLLDQVAGTLENLRRQIEEEAGRSGASIIIMTALITALGKAAPGVLSGVIEQLEQSEQDLARSESHRATARELAECLAALRALRAR